MTEHTTPPVVRLRELTRTYGPADAPVHALDGVSLDLAEGTWTAVMGPSGSGKSTLLHCAAGLDRPTSGDVLIGGVRLGDLDETRLTRLRRDRVGFVFQSFNLLPSLTAEMNAALPLLLARRRPRRAEVRDALAAVGLADRATHRPAELSGGQRQRVAIARALITEPQVVFADEPTGALDSTSGREVLELLRALVDERKRAVVMVTHDPVAASYADRVVFLRDGRVAGEQGQPTPRRIAERMTELERR
ncbi:ABC transporter ATP-binding protein [Virgisporangium aliadipatigenens]|uniref:ABC transporter ATP-binding protein n=1 Tax=Virgisporangium aliadipatigenens TaxID=741659 RepID=A0A8J3YLJ6_9ACTN|nr:ABC transporter ATP-binding protein [Virgisporangium aliadipatigenens]GIJ46175.1 ABC transporter ATP-binding protein [Virgisporangium aliadipatigenens]